ncbi:MAG TPA: sialidase family protein [Verrucomicrobiae bacterium]|nr:sialidase family protein [Verrucomicrobiae bacterium]
MTSLPVAKKLKALQNVTLKGERHIAEFKPVHSKTRGHSRCLAVLFAFALGLTAHATVVSTRFGKSSQVNVDAAGRNIPGDAANEPSMCIDPTNPNRMAIGWRQFDSTNSNFRQSGVAYSTNGGLNWTFPGNLEPGTFRSDPVLASDSAGNFYFLGITNPATFACDLLRSTNGGMNWQALGPALGGDKEWIAIDTTAGPGHGNIYQVWSPVANLFTNSSLIFTRSIDGGSSWMQPMDLPHSPYFGTVDIGPDGEVYLFGSALDIEPFVLNRSTNAQDRLQTPTIDLTTIVDLGGPPLGGGINPDGLIGQAWIAVDRSSGPTRGNVYVLSSVTNDPGNACNVMFSRSVDRGQTFRTPLRINDDSPTNMTYHWFGALSVAPNGRVDACWYDTRHSTNNALSELYYSWSDDGGLTWAPNRQISPPFDQSLGYPQQDKIGDYIQMVSLDGGACIAYTATFNGEEDIYFVRPELPIIATASQGPNGVRITWNSVPGINYCVQAKPDLATPWSNSTNVACIVASGTTTTVTDPAPSAPRFYRVTRP